MAILGSVVVGLMATTTNFDKPIKKSEDTVTSFGEKSKLALAKVAQFAQGIVVAGTSMGAALGALGASSAAAISEQGKIADRLGSTTAKFGELSYAVKLSRGDVDALAPSLERLRLNLADASIGGPVADAIKELGLSAATLESSDTSDAFRSIATGLSRIGDEGTRARLAVQLLGPDATKLMNALSNPALGNSSLEFRKLGGAVTELDRNSVSRALLSFDRVKLVFEGIGNTVAVKLAPYLEAGVDLFVKWASSGDGLTGKLAQGFEWVADKTANFFDFIQVGYMIAKPTLMFVRDLTIAIGKGIIAVMEFAGEKVDDLRLSLNGIKGEKPWSDSIRDGFVAIKKRSDELTKSVKNVGAATTVMASKVEAANGLWEQTRTPLEKYRIELEKIANLQAKGAINADVARRARIQAGVAAGLNETKFTGALTLNSAEARSAVLQANSRDRLVNGDMQRSTAATAAYTRDSSISLRTLVTRANREQESVLNFH